MMKVLGHLNKDAPAISPPFSFPLPSKMTFQWGEPPAAISCRQRHPGDAEQKRQQFMLGLSMMLGCVLHLVVWSCPTLCDPMGHSPPASSVHGDSPDENTGVGCHTLHQGIFPTQE